MVEKTLRATALHRKPALSRLEIRKLLIPGRLWRILIADVSIRILIREEQRVGRGSPRGLAAGRRSVLGWGMETDEC